jgi:hypothetical protein
MTTGYGGLAGLDGMAWQAEGGLRELEGKELMGMGLAGDRAGEEEMDCGEEEMDCGEEEMDCGEEEMDCGEEEMDCEEDGPRLARNALRAGERPLGKICGRRTRVTSKSFLNLIANGTDKQAFAHRSRFR